MTAIAADAVPPDTTGWTAPYVLTGSKWLCSLLVAEELPADVSFLEEIDAGDLADLDPVEVETSRSTTPEGVHETTPGPAEFVDVEDTVITGWVWSFLTPHAAWTTQSAALSMPGRIMRMVLLTEPYEVTTAETIIIDAPDATEVEYEPAELTAP